MGKYITIALLVVAIAIVSIWTFGLFRRGSDMGDQLRASKEKMEMLSKENDELRAQIDYFSKDENFEKELRAKFNYKDPNEKVMIITP